MTEKAFFSFTDNSKKWFEKAVERYHTEFSKHHLVITVLASSNGVTTFEVIYQDVFQLYALGRLSTAIQIYENQKEKQTESKKSNN
jgi:hypothetical protein